jgi:EAL domain-containing protein (putative c-di-GMP-specific phosphodiesterase class I)
LQDGFAMYDPAQDAYARDRLILLNDLRRGMDQDELLLHHQPKLDLRSGSIVGVEALVRWRHPERGLVPPDQFIPLAEESGLINRLTRWVLKAALRAHRQLHGHTYSMPVAVNLSMRDLHDPDLPTYIADLLHETSLSPDCLKVEVTESALMADPVRATGTLQTLLDYGIEAAIDDFGSGYASLGYLKQLPVREIKLDRSFVWNVAVDVRDRAIVAASVDMAHQLGMRVVAEGVEDAAAIETLADLGCDLVQGYYISRPLPCDELHRWLIERLPRDAAARLAA